MYDIGQSIHHHPPTPLFRHIFIRILGIHMLLRKIAIPILEPLMVHGEQLAKHLVLDLLDKVVNGIAVDKTSLFGVVCVQIKIKGETVLFAQMVG